MEGDTTQEPEPSMNSAPAGLALVSQVPSGGESEVTKQEDSAPADSESSPKPFQKGYKPSEAHKRAMAMGRIAYFRRMKEARAKGIEPARAFEEEVKEKKQRERVHSYRYSMDNEKAQAELDHRLKLLDFEKYDEEVALLEMMAQKALELLKHVEDTTPDDTKMRQGLIKDVRDATLEVMEAKDRQRKVKREGTLLTPEYVQTRINQVVDIMRTYIVTPEQQEEAASRLRALSETGRK